MLMDRLFQKYYLLIILIAFVIFSGCIEKTQVELENNPPSNSDLNVISQNIENLGANNLINEVGNSSTGLDWEQKIKGCEKCGYSVGYCTYTYECILELASTVEDCSVIHDEVNRIHYTSKFKVFKENCVSDFAIRNNDVTLCLTAGSKIGTCARELADKISDFNLCDALTNLNLIDYSRKQCYLDIASKDSSFEYTKCDEIFGLEYDDCYKAVALTQNKRNLCDELSTTAKQQSCLDEYIVKNRSKDILLCNYSSNSGACARDALKELGEQVTKAQCVTLRDQINGVGHDTYSNCFYTVGLRDLDVDACNKIMHNDLQKEECINKVNHILSVN